MMYVQEQNCLMMHSSEHMIVSKWHMTEFILERNVIFHLEVSGNKICNYFLICLQELHIKNL